MEEDFIVTIDDVRRTGHCVGGIRAWFRINKLDFKDFLERGISARRVLEIGDGLGVNVVKRVQERRNGRS